MKIPIHLKTLGMLLMALPFSAKAFTPTTQIFYDSFEDPVVAGVEDATDPTGWADLSTNTARAGLGNIAATYTNEVGNQAARLNIYNATPKLETTTAILNKTLAANTRYELRYNAASSSSSYTVYADLYAGTTLVMSAIVSPGTSKNFALGAAEAIHIVVPGDPGIGQPLKIVLRETHTGNPWNQPLYIDELTLDAFDTTLDNTPPAPAMTWVDVPTPAGDDGMLMTASTATDDNFVEYYFENKTLPSHNSGWIETTTWKDTGLADGVTYTYRVKARDKSPNQNETAWSPEQSATANADVLFYDSFESPLVAGATTGTDPSGWADVSTQGNRAGLGNIAATYTNEKGVQAAWLNIYNAVPILETTTTILNETLAANTNYYLRFNAASTSAAYTAHADLYAGTTLVMTASVSPGTSKNFSNGAAEEIHLVLPEDPGIGEPLKIVLRETRTSYSWDHQLYIDNLQLVGESTANDFDPPTPDPMTWVDLPTPAGDNGMLMTASTATDTNFVEYYFENMTLPSHNSGWIETTTWQDTGLEDGVTYEYRVKARDKSPNHNETAWSPVQSATANSDVIFYDSFESPLVDGTATSTDPSDWTDASTQGNRAGLGDLNGAGYPNLKGDQAARLNVYNAVPILDTTTANLDKALAANTNYTLSFNAASTGSSYVAYADLYAGTTLVMTAQVNMTNSADKDFADNVAEATQFVSCDVAAIGEPLKIRLRVTGGNWNQECYIDNLQLVAETVPTTLESIARANGADPLTNATSVSWDVTFDCAVGGLSGDNFSLDSSSGVTVSGGISVAPGGSHNEYLVTANGVSGCGTLKLVFANNDGLASPLTNTLPYEDGEEYQIDTIAPVISCAKQIVATASIGGTAPVTYAPTAYDECEGVIPVVCDPASGFAFPIGVTEVECTATDSAGNVGTASFNVVVVVQQPVNSERTLEGVSVRGDVVAAGTGIGPDAVILGIGSAFLNDSGDVVFDATLQGNGANNSAVFHRPEGGTPSPVAVKGNSFGAGAYGNFSNLSLNDAGGIGFQSLTSGNLPGHFTGPGAGPVANSARRLGASPSGGVYNGLYQPALASNGELLTPAALLLGNGGVTSLNDSVITSSAGTVVAREGSPSGIGAINHGQFLARVVASDADGRYAFPSLISESPPTGGNAGIFVGQLGGSPTLAVRKGDAAAGTPGTFSSFLGESVNSDGEIALRAFAIGGGITVADNEGIWTNSGNPSAPPVLVAREGDVAPCIAGGLVAFSSFGTIYMGDDGSVCFLAYLKDSDAAPVSMVNASNDASIWLWRNGALDLIVREGDLANSTDGAVVGRIVDFDSNGDAAGGNGIAYSVEFAPISGDTTSRTNQAVYVDRGGEDLAPVLVLRRGDKFTVGEDEVDVLSLRISSAQAYTPSGSTGGFGRAINGDGDVLLNVGFTGSGSGIFVLGSPLVVLPPVEEEF